MYAEIYLQDTFMYNSVQLNTSTFATVNNSNNI